MASGDCLKMLADGVHGLALDDRAARFNDRPEQLGVAVQPLLGERLRNLDTVSLEFIGCEPEQIH